MHLRSALKGSFKATLESLVTLFSKKRYRVISQKQFIEMRTKQPDLVLIDCRDPKSYAATGFIAGSINIPFTEFASSMDRIPQDQTIVTVCYYGIYSRTAAQKLLESGFKDAFSLKGGMDDWIDQDLPLAEQISLNK